MSYYDEQHSRTVIDLEAARRRSMERHPSNHKPRKRLADHTVGEVIDALRARFRRFRAGAGHTVIGNCRCGACGIYEDDDQ